jgi:small-conductance mechanosensitive channel
MRRDRGTNVELAGHRRFFAAHPFSSRTALYLYRMKEFLLQVEEQLNWLPPWVVGFVLIVGAVVVGLVAHRLLYNMLTRLVASWDLFWRSLISRTERPARFAIVVAALTFAVSVAPLTETQASLLRHILLIGFIGLIGWMSKSAVHIWMIVYLRRYKLDAEDNLLARKHVTQSKIMKRIADLLIVIVAIAAALMTFEPVRQYGVSLLASAGVAGIQLAITQPIRIDDALLVEGEWGNVEEITSTYVVVKLWDWRRMILPLSYFMEKPFQNWTRESSSLIGTVMIYLDYSVPVASLRSKVEEIAAASSLWDRRVVNVAVTDFRETVLEIRILVSASSAGRTFDLRCEVREKLIAFIQQDYPKALPQLRMDMRDLAPNPAVQRQAAE